MMQNPFITTFSKLPDYTYIPTEQQKEIIENFSFLNPTESVYKITGIRGSGKTVLLGKIEREMLSNNAEYRDWLVYRLTVGRDMLQQMASLLYKEDFVKEKKKEYAFFDIGIEIETMLQAAAKNQKKILIGIDEVSKTPEMVIFALEFGKWLRAGYPVYLVCTGLYDNIEQLYNEKNLTFFRRATTVKMEPLNFIKMAEMYKKQLRVDAEAAKELARCTKGYPYAFQELGVLYFKNLKSPVMDEIMDDLKSNLFAYSYEKIWEEMTKEDRELTRLLCEKEEYKREELLAKMKKPNNYSVYRDRLLKRGVIAARQGYISLALPFFNEYVLEYGG